jgi:hypothetical protein
MSTDENASERQREAARSTVRYTCSGCTNTWPGVSRCHCAGCHETFSGLALFDRHRRDIKGVGTCLDPASIMVESKDGSVERVMYLTGDLWYGVETPAARGGHLVKADQNASGGG